MNARDFGALGDGTTDDTQAINRAIAYQNNLGVGTVYIPPGKYMIKGHVPGDKNIFLKDKGGIELRDNVTLSIDNDATLCAIPNSESKYAIIRCYDKHNVTVTGGTIKGDRSEHTGMAGEWGYGIAITAGANITIDNVKIEECWGDGIDIQQTSYGKVTTNVVLGNVTSNHNRRQGLSIEGVKGFYAYRCTFSNTSGTAPRAGVDIEPYNNSTPVEDITFRECTFTNNDGPGLIAMMNGLRRLKVEGCTFTDNAPNETQLKVYASSDVNDIQILNNTLSSSGNNVASMLLQGGYNYVVDGNSMDESVTITDGYNDEPISGVAFTNNTMVPLHGETQNTWIRVENASEVTIKGNLIDSSSVVQNDAYGVRLVSASNILIDSNVIINVARSVSVTSGTSNIRVTGNTVENSAIAGILSGPVDGLVISYNTFAGIAHDNASGPVYYAFAGGTGIRVTDNTFIQAPRILNTAGLGGYRAISAITKEPGKVIDITTDNNILVKDPSRVTFSLFS